LERRNIVNSAQAKPALHEMEARLHRRMEATGDPFEHGKRGPRGFIDISQRWANPEQWKDWGTA